MVSVYGKAFFRFPRVFSRWATGLCKIIASVLLIAVIYLPEIIRFTQYNITYILHCRITCRKCKIGEMKKSVYIVFQRRAN